jgi:hypothetical protein
MQKASLAALAGQQVGSAPAIRRATRGSNDGPAAASGDGGALVDHALPVAECSWSRHVPHHGLAFPGDRGFHDSQRRSFG